jgi:hypothetical protein
VQNLAKSLWGRGLNWRRFPKIGHLGGPGGSLSLILLNLFQNTTAKIHEHKMMERRSGSIDHKKMEIIVELQMLIYLWDLIKLAREKNLSDKVEAY